MRNYIQDGVAITLTAPHDVSSGDGLQVGSLFGVVATNAASGEDVETVMQGVFELPKTDSEQVAQGEPLYWDEIEKRLTTTASDNLKVGAAVLAAGPAEPSVRARLSGYSA
ncbi:Predicted phage recombinase, RecA/RadA family [Pseudovibrio ascidiaceicola]|uniref:Predicted phage recombinase, RecA/RadA family n=1 Tax=Pseudovibrio ascidiaceicola TaxID=285279 RepID=A0A1I3Z285_9HYPH|nr:DUF2190 family protein [Pseudovibrio ascidiaceicola]SFK37769.1 Predicted phage recombinase, RecA/RadA family [Pseudovibrio ascidiaceicola]